MKTVRFSFFVLLFTLSFGLAANAATIEVTLDSSILYPSDVLDGSDGYCSLREAITNANADAATYADCTAGDGEDTIELESGKTYNLTLNGSPEDSNVSGDLDINSDIIITVDGTAATIDGADLSGHGNPDRIFQVGAGDSLTLQNVTVQTGKVTTTSGNITGGCIQVGTNGSLTLTSSTVQNCDLDLTGSASFGGGAGIGVQGSNATATITDSIIQNNEISYSASSSEDGRGSGVYVSSSASVTISGTTFTSNTISVDSGSAQGGAIYSNATSDSTVTTSTFDSNSATSASGSSSGGAVYLSNNSTWTFSKSLFESNSANVASSGSVFARGGAIDTRTGDETNIINCTFSGNSTTGNLTYGGAIFSSPSSGDTLKISHSTIAGNTSGDGSSTTSRGGGLMINGNNFSFINTIVANNQTDATTTNEGPDCYLEGAATVTSLGYNAIEDSTDCSFTEATGDRVDVEVTSSSLDEDLEDNGGETETLAIFESTIFHDTGTCTDVDGNTIDEDQRGAPRSDGSCDIGAYEYATFYTDSDGDGYGDSGATSTETYSDGLASNNTDCDDSDTNVNPGATELCDGEDNDCDGDTDEGYDLGDSCTVGTGACEASGTIACSSTTESSCNATAGDPSDEVCDDSIDNDCDGSTDEDCSADDGSDDDGDGSDGGADDDGDEDADDGDADGSANDGTDDDADDSTNAATSTTSSSCQLQTGHANASHAMWSFALLSLLMGLKFWKVRKLN